VAPSDIIIIIIIITTTPTTTTTTTTTTAIVLSPGGSSPTLVQTKIKNTQNNKTATKHERHKKTKYSRTSNNGHCRGIQILSVIGGVR
jgi:hypothetical protein